MSRRIDQSQLLTQGDLVAPPTQRACEDRTFELPPVLHILTAALFLGFVGVLSFAFRNPNLAVPFGVFVAFIVAFFYVPALWARMAPDQNLSSALKWQPFVEDGIDTATGRTSGTEATVLVLLLPFLIFCWAIAVAVIAALL